MPLERMLHFVFRGGSGAHVVMKPGCSSSNNLKLTSWAKVNTFFWFHAPPFNFWPCRVNCSKGKHRAPAIAALIAFILNSFGIKTLVYLPTLADNWLEACGKLSVWTVLKLAFLKIDCHIDVALILKAELLSGDAGFLQRGRLSRRSTRKD
jgi:hypothetical protein